jgi:RimJ/RimL family protein N-acetyltransferase
MASDMSSIQPDRRPHDPMMGQTVRLLGTQVDAVHGLAPARDGSPVRDIVGTGPALAVFGWSAEGGVLAVRRGVPGLPPDGDLLRATGLPPAYAPDVVPAVIADLATRIRVPNTISGGPSFVFPDNPARPATAPPAPLPVLVPDADGLRRAARLRRPATWEAGEWAELIAGDSGGWAMAVERDEPVSIAHTPARGADSSEVGVWTRPDRRGRGLAAVVVRAWWERECLAKPVLFYCTSRDNAASRSVARQLGLTPLGWLWSVRRA